MKFNINVCPWTTDVCRYNSFVPATLPLHLHPNRHRAIQRQGPGAMQGTMHTRTRAGVGLAAAAGSGAVRLDFGCAMFNLCCGSVGEAVSQ